MLTVFDSFRIPEVPYVDVFRDSEKTNKFWILPDRPRIGVDATSGEKLFNYNLIARDVDIALASADEGAIPQHQLGFLNMTVDLSIPEADMNMLRTELRKKLNNERGRKSTYLKLFKKLAGSVEPEIAYANTWTAGTVRIDLLEGLGDTFKRASSTDVPPNLRGNCSAALWATFGSEGAQIMWNALHPDDSGSAPLPSGALPLQANIRYELVGISRVPELEVTIEAHGETVYKELRERIQVIEKKDKSTYSYPQISELTKSLVDDSVIKIVWDDHGIPSSDPDADDIKTQLQQTVLGVVTNQIVTKFFSQFVLQGLQEGDLGETFTHTMEGIPGSRLWLNEYKEEFISDIFFSLNYRTNMLFNANPQTSLLATLTTDEIASHVRLLDAGNPQIQVLNVQMETNADFERDKIANVTAHVSYDEFDTATNRRIQQTKSFVFRKPEDRYVFNARMARDTSDRLIDRYKVRAEINYVGTTDSPPPIELADINDRALTLSYDRLGYVNVEVQAGDIDWDEINQVFVEFDYFSAPNEPDARGSVLLTSDERLGVWRTSKHGRTDSRYRFHARYIFKDGREVESKTTTDHRERLVIHDNLAGRLSRTFDVVLSPAHVTAVNLKVRYENPPQETDEEAHIFNATGSWEYMRPLSEGAPTELKYRYLIEYADGHVQHIDWQSLAADANIEPIVARRFPLNIMVDGGGLDWQVWRRVVAEITYRDDANDFVQITELLLDQGGQFQRWEILAFSPTARDYDYRVLFIPKDAANHQVEEKTGRKAGILLLETLI